MNQSHRPFDHNREQIDQAFYVRSPGQSRIEFASPQGAVAGAVENGAELMPIEKPAELVVILGIASDDVTTPQRPVVALADADHLPRIFHLEVVKRVVPRDAGNAGDEERKRRWGEGVRHLPDDCSGDLPVVGGGSVWQIADTPARSASEGNR